MKENTRLHQLREDAQRKRKNAHVIKGLVMWLRKTCANPKKVCKQLFLLSWNSG